LVGGFVEKKKGGMGKLRRFLPFRMEHEGGTRFNGPQGILSGVRGRGAGKGGGRANTASFSNHLLGGCRPEVGERGGGSEDLIPYH